MTRSGVPRPPQGGSSIRGGGVELGVEGGEDKMQRCAWCRQWMQIEPGSTCLRCGGIYVGMGYWLTRKAAAYRECLEAWIMRRVERYLRDEEAI